MSPQERGTVCAMITYSVVIWAAVGYVLIAGIDTAPWWALPTVLGVAAVTAIAVGRHVVRQG